jgi:hypothetical protein
MDVRNGPPPAGGILKEDRFFSGTVLGGCLAAGAKPRALPSGCPGWERRGEEDACTQPAGDPPGEPFRGVAWVGDSGLNTLDASGGTC